MTGVWLPCKIDNSVQSAVYTRPNTCYCTVRLKWSLPYHANVSPLLVLSSRDIGTTSIPYSPNREPASSPHHLLTPPSGPLAYVGGAEGRKRRSPSSYKGKTSKLSRPGKLESLFGNGSDSGGLLSLGPESSRQVHVTHRLCVYYHY